MSSPFMFVFGDGRVTCQTRIDDIPSNVVDV